MKSGYRHLMYTRLVTGILYGKALEQTFLQLRWELTGLILFIAMLLTTVRYFLATIILLERIAPEDRPLSEFADFWTNLMMAGMALMLSKYQGDVRMIYLVLGMVLLDLIWCVKHWLLRETVRISLHLVHALQGRVAIDVLAGGMLVLLALSEPFPLLAVDALPLDDGAILMIAVTLIGASLGDFILNSRLYALE